MGSTARIAVVGEWCANKLLNEPVVGKCLENNLANVLAVVFE